MYYVLIHLQNNFTFTQSSEPPEQNKAGRWMVYNCMDNMVKYFAYSTGNPVRINIELCEGSRTNVAKTFDGSACYAKTVSTYCSERGNSPISSALPESKVATLLVTN